MKRLPVFFFVILALSLAACSSAPASPVFQPTEPPAAQEPSAVPTLTLPRLSFEAVTYRNNSIGFEFDYPVRWLYSDPVILGDRAGQIEFTAPEGRVLSLVLYRWDPVGDLPAYLAHRQSAWEASGTKMVSEESTITAGRLPTTTFILQSQDGVYVYVGYVPVGDRYIEFSSPVGYDLLRAVISTVRPITAP